MKEVMSEEMGEETTERELRIVLDAAATQALEAMTRKLKTEMPAVKVQPSQFVSFLVSDFFRTYFEKDMAVLTAEFFDSDAYYEAERRKAKGSVMYEELMAEALERARKIKGKKRRMPGRRKSLKANTSSGDLTP